MSCLLIRHLNIQTRLIFTFDFKKEKKFNLEGATRDYEDINVGKALSDMKKDAVLDKYKFFVDSPNLGTDNDGTVRIVRR